MNRGEDALSEEELQAKMNQVYQEQQKCLKIQKVLVVITIFSYLLGFIPLFIHLFIAIIWGTILTNRASVLAKEKYPCLGMCPVGRGYSWDPPIVEAATRNNDSLTVKILSFNMLSKLIFGAAFLGYGFMLTAGAQLLIWILDFLLKIIRGDFLP